MTISSDDVRRRSQRPSSLEPASPGGQVDADVTHAGSLESATPGNDNIMLGLELGSSLVGEGLVRKGLQRTVGTIGRRGLRGRVTDPHTLERVTGPAPRVPYNRGEQAAVAGREVIAGGGAAAGGAAPHLAGELFGIENEGDAGRAAAEGFGGTLVGGAALNRAGAVGRHVAKTRTGRRLADKFREGTSRGAAAVREFFGLPEQFRPPDDTAAVQEAHQLLMDQKAGLTAGQTKLGASRRGSVEGFLSGAFGGDTLERTQQRGRRNLTSQIKDFAARVAEETSPREMGTMLQNAVVNDESAWRTVSAQIYDLVDEVGNGARVRYGPVQVAAREELAKVQIKEPKLVAIAEELIHRGGSKSAEKIAPTTLINELSFGEAVRLKQELQALKRQSSSTTQGFIKKMIGVLDDSMAGAGGELNPEAIALLHTAEEFYAQGFTKYNRTWLKAVLKHVEPEQIARAALHGQNRSTRIALLRDAVQDQVQEGTIPKDTWARIQGGYLSDVFEHATKAGSEGSELSSDLLGKALRRYGDDALDELFPGPKGKRAIDGVRKLRRALEIAERGGMQGSNMAIKILQTGAAIGVVTVRTPFGEMDTGQKIGFGALAFGPSGLAQVLADPLFVRALITGLTRTLTPVVASRAGGKAATGQAMIAGEKLFKRAIELRDQGVDIVINPKVEERLNAQNKIEFSYGEVIKAGRDENFQFGSPRVTVPPAGSPPVTDDPHGLLLSPPNPSRRR